MLDGGEVRANLVAERPRDLDAHPRPPREAALLDVVARLRRPRRIAGHVARVNAGVDAALVLRMARDGELDRPAVGEVGLAAEEQVGLVEAVGLEPRLQALERVGRARHDDEPRGVGVQAVEQPGLARRVADPRELRVVADERVGERAGLPLEERRGGLAGGLVHHEDPRGLEHDDERRVGLGYGRAVLLGDGLGHDCDDLPLGDDRPLRPAPPVHPDGPVRDRALHLGARDVRG